MTQDTHGGGDALARIAAEGDALEQGGAGAGLALDAGIEPGGAPVALDTESAAIWALIPQTLGSLLAMSMPELAEVYTKEACAQWGASMVPVANKYGWNIGPDSPELAVLACSAPFILGTGAALLKRKRAAPGAAAPPRPGQQPPVRPGTIDAAPPQINAE